MIQFLCQAIKFNGHSDKVSGRSANDRIIHMLTVLYMITIQKKSTNKKKNIKTKSYKSPGLDIGSFTAG